MQTRILQFGKKASVFSCTKEALGCLIRFTQKTYLTLPGLTSFDFIFEGSHFFLIPPQTPFGPYTRCSPMCQAQNSLWVSPAQRYLLGSPSKLLVLSLKSMGSADNQENEIAVFTESQNHRIARVGRDLKDHESPTPLPHAGPPTIPPNARPGCPGPHPIWL